MFSSIIRMYEIPPHPFPIETNSPTTTPPPNLCSDILAQIDDINLLFKAKKLYFVSLKSFFF